MNPFVSVIVTTYNQRKYIQETIESVLNQTYKDYEVIVVDDGSTDDTPDVMSQFGKNIIYCRQTNMGIANSRNTGIRMARGELLAFLDGDDIWNNEKLFIQVDVAKRNPKSGMIVVDGVSFDENGIQKPTLFHGSWCKELKDNAVVTGPYYSELLQQQLIFTTSQVMVPKNVLQCVGLSNQKFKRSSDYDFYLRIASKYDITFCSKRLVYWRYIPTSASGPNHLRQLTYLPEEIEILKKQLRECSISNRRLVKRMLSEKMEASIRNLYYWGTDVNKSFATRMLLKIYLSNPFSPTLLLFVAGIWCTKPVRNFGKRAQLILRALSNKSLS